MRDNPEGQHGRRTGRVRRRLGGPGAVPVLVLATALALTTACSPPTPSHATAATPTAGVPRPSTRTLPHSPMIAAGTSAAAVSVAVSNALFNSAPTVVLAAEHDQPAQGAAADAAVRLGVPLLLLPATNRVPSAPEVAAEVHRLKATDVLAVGIDAALVRTQLPELTIHPASHPRPPPPRSTSPRRPPPTHHSSVGRR